MNIKNNVKGLIKKLPGISNLVQKNEILENQLNEVKHQCVLNGRKAIEYRLKFKTLNNEKINVIFVCHRPAVWESLHSVYDVLNQDEDFNVSIVAIPNKKELPDLGLNHEEYESEGAEEFWKEYGCINGYDYEKREWFDLKKLNPDYVFFQQPYNITRCEEYKSWNVAQYAKICYVPYAYDFIGNGVLEETTPKDFMCDISFYFTQNNIDDHMVRDILKKYLIDDVKTVVTGFPRYDNLEQYKESFAKGWDFAEEGNYRVMWTPRWCTNEGNCNFFQYKDNIVKYALKHKDVSLLFRPHPQAFLNWNRTGEFPKKEADAYQKIYAEADNMSIDAEKSYFNTIFNSDCLISDTSSFIADYFTTGKPIIYCHKVDTFNELSKKMCEGFYWVNNWEELKKVLDDLKNGKDVLKERRLQLLQELFGRKQNAGETIKEIIKQDVRG